MSILTIVAVGWPVHRVETYALWRDDGRAEHTDWTTACGESSTVLGRQYVFATAGGYPIYELCERCFPDPKCRGYGGDFPSPREVVHGQRAVA